MNIQNTIKVAVQSNMPCLLVGKHGTGKSYAIVKEAETKKKKLHRVIITQETTPEDLVCQYELKDNATVMIKHALLEAAENGDWICFEEINMGSPAVLTLLNGLLETDPASRYIKFQDLEVKPHEDFRMFATANPTGYSGANKMNDALLSRFLVQLVQPDYAKFLLIIKKKTGDETILNDVKAFLSALKKIEKNYDIYVSPREMLIYADLRISGLKHTDAIELIMGRHYDLEPDIFDDIMAMFEVESTREEILILNNTELQIKIDEATKEANERIKALEREIETAKEFKAMYEKARQAFGA